MRRCKTCVFWENPKCDFVDRWYPKIPQESKAEIHVTVDDDSNLNVELHTGPEFGCVQHVEKTS